MYLVSPVIVNDFGIIRRKIGSNLTIFCDFQGSPMPNITWFKGNSFI